MGEHGIHAPGVELQSCPHNVTVSLMNHFNVPSIRDKDMCEIIKSAVKFKHLHRVIFNCLQYAVKGLQCARWTLASPFPVAKSPQSTRTLARQPAIQLHFRIPPSPPFPMGWVPHQTLAMSQPLFGLGSGGMVVGGLASRWRGMCVTDVVEAGRT